MANLADILARTKVHENCLLWTGALMPNGYGQVKVDGTQWSVHRLVWTLLKGPIPLHLMVLHACNARGCCNIDHLYLGTNGENQNYRAISGNYKNRLGVVGVNCEKVGNYTRYTARGARNGQRTILYRGPSFEAACQARKAWEATCL